MAIGDIVGAFSGSGAQLQYQPAGTIKILVTTIGGGANSCRIHNGSVYSSLISNQNITPVKFFIDNSFYLHLDAQGAGNYGGFTGIVIGV